MGLVIEGRGRVWRAPMNAPAASIRSARVAERDALECLQRRSSTHDPMYRGQLADHPDAIELPVAQITAGLVRVAEQDGVVVGFAVLLERSADACELDGLFVDPDRMRAGVGHRLVEDAKRIARAGVRHASMWWPIPRPSRFTRRSDSSQPAKPRRGSAGHRACHCAWIARPARANALLAHTFPHDVASSQRSSATLAPAAASDD